MKKQWKGFLSGVIVTTLVFSLGIPALAATVRQLNANYSGIQITLDGKKVEPKDANGVAVEPFAVDGTTYLPLRAMASALGLGVEWDGATQTVKLTSTSGATTAPPLQAANMDKFEQFKAGLTTAGYVFEEVKMAASMVGASDGVKYKFDVGNVELYRYDATSAAYKLALSSGKITMDGFGSFDATVRDGMALILSAGAKNSSILTIFNGLK